MTIKDLLLKIYKENPVDHDLLTVLVNEIRPKNPDDWQGAEKKLYNLIIFLKEDQELAEALGGYLYRLLYDKKIIRLLTESGILSNDGFYKETARKISHSLLPPLYQDKDLSKILNAVFHKKTDYLWINKIPGQYWIELFNLAGRKEDSEDLNLVFKKQLLNAILVLSQRITSLGLEPEIIDKIPELEEFDSPFLIQNKEVLKFLEDYESYATEGENPQLTYIIDLLYQCQKYIETIRGNKGKFGASFNLTYTLQRLNQNIRRIRILLRLVTAPGSVRKLTEIDMFKELVKSENKKNSIRDHIKSNIDLVAFQITEHAGKTGEHYITNNKKEYKKMFFSALGGGFIVGFLTIFKTAIYYLRLPLFGEAFMYSMNYSFGFVTIHLTKSTLATKQPAMTASKIAGSLDTKNAKEHGLDKLVELMVKTSRSQFIALIGNVIMAFPIAYLASLAIFYVTGEHLAGPAKANSIINEINPFHSLALFHAAIAGVYLFVAGLISGYYDNKNVYNKIALRVNEHPRLKNILGTKILGRLSGYIDRNLGSLVGNFMFGIFLGSTGTLGFILGLPIDIRHITFASGNFGIAMAGLENQVSISVVLISVLGIFGIGLVNLFVSFGLAIFVAIKSRKVNFKESKKLLKMLYFRFLLSPHDFFFAPDEKESTSVEEAAKPSPKPEGIES
jgi:site-specific recombinase